MTTHIINTQGLTQSVSVDTPSFKRVFKELHDGMIAVGMVQTTDTGQLDLETLPSSGNIVQREIYGFKCYKMEDGISLPVYLKVIFRVAAGASSGRILWHISVSIGLGTNGDGTLTQATPAVELGTTAGYLNLDLGKIGLSFPSMFCMANGYLGVSFKQGIIPAAQSGPGPAAHSTLFNFFICRDSDDSGAATAEGVSLICAAPGGIDYGSMGAPPVLHRLGATGELTSTVRPFMAIGADTLTAINGKIPVFNCHTLTPAPKRLSQLMIATRPASAGSATDIISIAPVGVGDKQFAVMNAAYPADIFSGASCRCCFAMLWE